MTQDNEDEATLNDIVGSVVAELYSAKDGFGTSKAALRLMQSDMAGTPAKMTGPQARIYRLGASAAVVQWSPSKRSTKRSRRVSSGDAAVAAAISGLGPQRDMAELSDDFDWIEEMTALDETRGAVRKVVGDLDYLEALQVSALKKRKSSEIMAGAVRIDKVIDANPAWARQPSTRLRQWASDDRASKAA